MMATSPVVGFVLLTVIQLLLSSGNACSPVTNPEELTASKGTHGTFSSPNYPTNYPDNADCHWLITAADEGDGVSLQFTDFSTENSYDIVYVYDGDDATESTLMAELSGQLSATVLQYASSGRSLYVRFSSDSNNAYTGFSASFTAIVSSGDSTTAAVAQEYACNADTRPQELTGLGGSFQSPNYPDNYPNNLDCQWRITAGEGYTNLSLFVYYFKTQYCCDHGYIYDGNSTEAKLMADLYGGIAPPYRWYRSTGRYLYFRFTSDSSISEFGFYAEYESTGPLTTTTTTQSTTPTTTAPASVIGCTVETRPLELTGIGYFTSPNYPSNYPDLSHCQWRISAIGNNVVTVVFTYFHTESYYDYVQLYDGFDVNAELIVQLSDNHAPPPKIYKSTGRDLFVRFISDESFNFPGFNATYDTTMSSALSIATNCGSVLHAVPHSAVNVTPGWGPLCYISTADISYINTPCRDLIKNIQPDIVDADSLLTHGGNFGCHALMSDDFVGAEEACLANRKQQLTLATVSSATSLIVCIQLGR